MQRSIRHDIVPALRVRARRSDAMVVAAALTCYAVFGLVPLLAIGTRVASWCFGRSEVIRTTRDLATFLAGPLHLDRNVAAFARTAATAPWWTVLVALVPVSLYAEGTVRSLQRFSRAPERISRSVRGRALTPVFAALATVFVVVTVGLLRPLLENPFGTGLGAQLLGILVAFNVLFFAVFAALLLVYRLFSSTPLRRGPLTFAAFAAASWIASQTLAYVLVVRDVSGFARAFGGYAPAAEVTALAFLIYLHHLVLVWGYLLALTVHELPVRSHERPASGRSDVGRDGAGRHGDERQPAAGMGRPADQEQPAGA